jgi:serine/threonine protein phosphatase PrpC
MAGEDHSFVPGQGRVLIGMLSRRGGRERNEDACGHWVQGEAGQQGPSCCVLADGAGGHGGGDVASQTAVSTVLQAFASKPGCDPEHVRELIELANSAVVSRQPLSEATRDMRSTLVVWLCDPRRGTAAWGHSGDSRLYCFRSRRMLLRTRDHSLYQSMIDAGMVDPAALRGNPQRNVLIASLGTLEHFQADVPTDRFLLLPGDAFLICSDGFWEGVGEAEMEDALERAADPQAWIEELGGLVERLARPGQDNYSALSVWYG